MSADVREEIGRHLQAMRAFAITLTHDSALADDIVQDAVTKAWIHADQFRSGSNLKAWLFTILRNTFYSHMRKRRLDTESMDAVPASMLSVSPGHDDALALRDFLTVFRTLSVQQREALLFVGALGFSYEEAAELCDVPVGTMKSRAHRARLLLAERLDFVSAIGATG